MQKTRYIEIDVDKLQWCQDEDDPTRTRELAIYQHYLGRALPDGAIQVDIERIIDTRDIIEVTACFVQFLPNGATIPYVGIDDAVDVSLVRSRMRRGGWWLWRWEELQQQYWDMDQQIWRWFDDPGFVPDEEA